MSGWQWQQTMLRIKDPVASVDYYTKNYGMTLLAKLDFPQWEFALYFLATVRPHFLPHSAMQVERSAVELASARGSRWQRAAALRLRVR